MLTSETELHIDNVTAGYAGVPAVQGLSLKVRPGEKVGMIGRNGAGKSTLLACAMGITQRLGGVIRLGGVDISQMPTHLRARMGLGYVPQGRDIFPSLSVEENLISALQGRPQTPALDKAFGLFPCLYERRKNGGNQLSGGEQQMLAVARALVSEPRILLLDEPLEGLAPTVRDELMTAIDRLCTETGVGCLLVEQHIDFVLDFSQKVILLERGVALFCGDPESLRQDVRLLDQAIGLQKV